MPLSAYDVTALARDYYALPLQQMLNQSPSERRIYFECQYGMPNPMPKFNYWPWIDRVIYWHREIKTRWVNVKLAAAGKIGDWDDE